MNKRTKIIATIGPASSSPQMIAKLIHAGMDAARLNFSHGERKEHRKRIKMIRAEAAKAGKHIAIIQDLQGPKLRVGDLKGGSAILKKGAEVTITARKVIGSSDMFSVTYPRLIKELKIDDRVLLDDGRLELKVVKKLANGLQCKVVCGGILLQP